MKNLNVVEIFCSLQGEGNRAGEASIFIRLAGCNQNCWFCDTDWKTAKEMTIEAIHRTVSLHNPVRWIVWTGGEPLLQLTEEIILYFKNLGYKQALETNGTLPIPKGLDYVSVSPKEPHYRLKEILGSEKVNEFRFVIHFDSWTDILEVPKIEELPEADYYYVSPMFIGDNKLILNEMSLQACVDHIIGEDPRWRLSVQQHKFWKIK